MPESLRTLADRVGLNIGCCVGDGPFLDPQPAPGVSQLPGSISSPSSSQNR
jgi:hypothetical protein